MKELNGVALAKNEGTLQIRLETLMLETRSSWYGCCCLDLNRKVVSAAAFEE